MEIIDIIPGSEEKDQGMSFMYGGDTCYRFTLNVDRFDEMVEWLFDHTEDRFVFLGTDRVYFENSLDAMAFKLAWL